MNLIMVRPVLDSQRIVLALICLLSVGFLVWFFIELLRDEERMSPKMEESSLVCPRNLSGGNALSARERSEAALVERWEFHFTDAATNE